MKHLYNRVDKRLLKEKLNAENKKRRTISFYKYAHIDDPNIFRNHLYEILSSICVFGRVYVSYEGVNGQISVFEDKIDALRETLNMIDFLRDVRFNFAIEDDGKSFYKLKIKVRDKIVADGLNDDTFDVTNRGVHLSAKAFNELTDRDDAIVIDMRNHYESEVGHFKKAILPDVETFREALPVVLDTIKDDREKHIVMYCTGGIRCEKASAYFKHKGFRNVYQLDGGIIEYARQVEQEGLDNKFIGKNFVFDERLGERITENVIASCHQCGAPCDTHTNCANDECHILFIQCDACREKYRGCCSEKCEEFNALDEDQKASLKGRVEFNGTKFGKGRYKAHKKDDHLDT